jgi:hypothetical protein
VIFYYGGDKHLLNMGVEGLFICIEGLCGGAEYFCKKGVVKRVMTRC